jgi:hypothetical protein
VEDGWIDSDRRIDRWTNGEMDGRIGEWTDRQMTNEEVERYASQTIMCLLTVKIYVHTT